MEEAQEDAFLQAKTLRALSPEDLLYFRSEIYQAKSRQEKMDDLWGMVMQDADGDDSPAPYLFEDFDQFFR